MDGPVIETPRLILRPPLAEDLDGFAAMAADEESARFIGGVQPRANAWRGMMTIAGCFALQGFGLFSVVEKESGRWIGRVGPWMPDGWPGTEVGWGLLPGAWGKGYALEAAEASIDWAFERLGWSEVIHCIDPENRRSARLAERLGATNRGPGALPPPFEAARIDIWAQSRDAWRDRRRNLTGAN